MSHEVVHIFAKCKESECPWMTSGVKVSMQAIETILRLTADHSREAGHKVVIDLTPEEVPT